MEWGASEPVIFGDVLMGLTQLKTLDLTLLHFSGLQQLPPHVTLLRLHSWKLLDIAMVPCLQSCSGLQSLELVGAQGLCRYAVKSQHCFSAQAVPSEVGAWLAGLVNVQLGPWPALTRLTLSNTLGDFRLRHWPPLEAEAIGLSSLAVLQVFVQSDATGLLQLEHTILDLMLKTSA